MADNEAESTSSKPIVDVAHPGKTAPSSNSKSVIITHSGGSAAQDPMVKPEDVEAVADAPSPAVKSSTKTKIMPLESSIKDIEAAQKADQGAQPEATPEPKIDEPAKDEETEADKTNPETREDVSPAAAGKKIIDEDAAAKAQTAKDAELQKLIDSKKYFLPINSIEKRRTKRTVAIGVLVSLLLVIAWADIALDAGLIQFDGSMDIPHTNFFSS